MLPSGRPVMRLLISACARRRGPGPLVKVAMEKEVPPPLLEQLGNVKGEPDAEPSADSDKIHHAEHQLFINRLRSETRDLAIFDFWSIASTDPDSAIGHAVRELKLYYEDWRSVQQDPFWHRKSNQTVLSVVVCRRSDGALVAHRGMNTEVSLPSGSLCAERAAIARAATMFHAAHELEAVAVLDPNDKINPLWPCEVCESWLAKLRAESSAISIIAVASSACESFVVRVNGKLQPPPRPTLAPPKDLADRVVLAQDTREVPWEAQQLVYVNASWDCLQAQQRHLLRFARSRGTHLLVGIQTDEVLQQGWERPMLQDFDTRLSELLDNRQVSSVLRDAPWRLTKQMIDDLGICRVVSWPTAAAQMQVEAARDAGIWEEAPLLERSRR